MLRAAILFIFLGAPALAQDLVYEPRSTRCVISSGGQENAARCIGASLRFCQENTPGGQTTIGGNACINAELQEWDQRLNLLYQALLRKHEEQEAANPDIYIVKESEALRGMQRAWIPYRDAACLYERAGWTNGRGATGAELFCRLQMTAEKAIAFQFAL